MSDLNTLQTIGNTLNIEYDSLKGSNMSSYTDTNKTSIDGIIQAINENMAYLTLIQNKLSTGNNIDQEILIKKDKLLRIENDTLTKQLQELQMIESNIANKDRIIEQTNNNIDQYNTNIYNLFICTLLAVILCIGIILYAYGKIDYKRIITLTIIIFLSYIIIYIYTYNVFYLKDSISYLINPRSIHSLETQLSTWANIPVIEQKIDDTIQQNSWINNNCECPVSEEEDSGNNPVYPLFSNEGVTSTEIPGYFYYDGTAPPQLLVPTPDPKSINLDDKIDWVDYSSNGNFTYDNVNKVMSYNNNNFYNYKNQTDPSIILNKEINGSQTLVGDTTYSTNF